MTSRFEVTNAVVFTPPAALLPVTRREGFVQVNGVRLHYLAWGGSGPALILIHGGMDNPYIFEDLAPAFADSFRVVAYARRGHGQSDPTGPFDAATLTTDLLGLMDTLHIDRAHLAGWSMGGNEATGMAVHHPDRVDRIVYLDGAFDCADPDFRTAFEAIPSEFLATPPSALRSLDAYRAYYQAEIFAPLDDMSRVEEYLRETVIVQPDGSVQPRMSAALQKALFEDLLADPPRKYGHVGCPVLAIFPHSQFNLSGRDELRREQASFCEKQYLGPLRNKFMAQVRAQLPSAQIMSVPGGHSDFFITSRVQVVSAMRRFLGVGSA